MNDYDIIVIGTGLAGSCAALKAYSEGKKVLMIDKSNSFGGTSKKSGGWIWIPNNRYMKQLNLKDKKEDCIKYMASLSFPNLFDSSEPNLGLSDYQFSMLEMFFDNSSVALDYYINNNLISFQFADTHNVENIPYAEKLLTEKNIDFSANNELLKLTPDYNATNEYNMMPIGRTVSPYKGFDLNLCGINFCTSFSDGLPFNLNISIMITQTLFFLELFLQQGFNLINQIIEVFNSKYLRNGTGNTLMGEIKLKIDNNTNIEVQLGKGVSSIIYECRCEKVSGVKLDNGNEIKCNDGVIIANGGFSHNKEKVKDIHPLILGTGAVIENVGDTFNMFREFPDNIQPQFESNEGWYDQTSVENAINSNGLLDSFTSIFFIHSPSSIFVDKYGYRYMNERLNYHMRGQTHFEADKYITFFIYDEKARQNFGGLKGPGGPIPYNKENYVIEASSIDELSVKINEKLNSDLIKNIIDFPLDPSFSSNLTETINKFNSYAESGKDLDFNRGEDIQDHAWFLKPKDDNTSINKSMQPISLDGPIYCIPISLALLDTKTTLVTNNKCQVLDKNNNIIKGLTAAGNVMAGYTGESYWSGGATLGNALTTGYLASSNF